jgi:hypothetical protein
MAQTQAKTKARKGPSGSVKGSGKRSPRRSSTIWTKFSAS